MLSERSGGSSVSMLIRHASRRAVCVPPMAPQCPVPSEVPEERVWGCTCTWVSEVVSLGISCELALGHVGGVRSVRGCPANRLPVMLLGARRGR